MTNSEVMVMFAIVVFGTGFFCAYITELMEKRKVCKKLATVDNILNNYMEVFEYHGIEPNEELEKIKMLEECESKLKEYKSLKNSLLGIEEEEEDYEPEVYEFDDCEENVVYSE